MPAGSSPIRTSARVAPERARGANKPVKEDHGSGAKTPRRGRLRKTGARRAACRIRAASRPWRPMRRAHLSPTPLTARDRLADDRWSRKLR